MKKTEEEIFKKVKEVIIDQLGSSDSDVVAEAHLTDDLGADSLDKIEMGLCIEEAFDMEIPDDELDKISTVNDIVQYLVQNLKD